MSTLSVSAIQNTASPVTNVVLNSDGSSTVALYNAGMAPTPVQTGTLWYDISGAGLVIWDGAAWAGVGGVGTVTQVDTGTGLTGGPINTTGTVSLDTAYTDGVYVKYVTAPSSSADTGAIGEVAVSPGFFYFFDGTQWLQVAGVTF